MRTEIIRGKIYVIMLDVKLRGKMYLEIHVDSKLRDRAGSSRIDASPTQRRNMNRRACAHIRLCNCLEKLPDPSPSMENRILSLFLLPPASSFPKIRSFLIRVPYTLRSSLLLRNCRTFPRPMVSPRRPICRMDASESLLFEATEQLPFKASLNGGCFVKGNRTVYAKEI